MSKKKLAVKATKETEVVTTAVTETTVDPVLASLFSSSSGPVRTPVRPVAVSVAVKEITKSGSLHLSNLEDVEGQPTSTSTSETSEVEDEAQAIEVRPRKRRRLSQEDDLEASYLDKLVRQEEKEELKRAAEKALENAQMVERDEAEDEDNDTASSASNDLDDLSDQDLEDSIPQHESLSENTAEYEKLWRTVFLGNVSTEAIKSKVAKKQLETHLKSVLNAEKKEVLESIRFRSTAFNVAAGPKRAAYAKKDLMDDTTKSTNAYAVFNTEVAAKSVAKQLNGTIVLDRHLHTDWLAHPSTIDHKRCVFVGNLNFVDLESSAETTEDGEKQKRRPRAKEPADAEEGLWRAFSKCGIVESVRVVRDKVTRIGKGFAYVQFVDEVAAEKALALDGKKFPPKLPRLLRVSRAKRVLKKDLKRKREEQGNTKSRKVLGGPRKGGPPSFKGKKMSGVVFEGYRASADKGMKFKNKGKKKGGVRPTTRSSQRGAAFRASGGKKKRDM